MLPERAPIWLVEHPTGRYVEDVKAVARKAGLRVMDAAAAGEAERAAAVPASQAPKLTLKAEFAPPAEPSRRAKADPN
jgi:hypothetical protein